MAIRGGSDKQTGSATKMLMSAVTITTPSGPLCMTEVRQIIVEEDMDHPLIGRPVLDEMGFVAIQSRKDHCMPQSWLRQISPGSPERDNTLGVRGWRWAMKG
jgi:hypothetical protein